MPKRPREHRIEQESVDKFSLHLPEEWLFRSKEKDYGLDGEVEIFENDVPTGILFWVQLKATDSKKDTDIFNYDFSIEALNYYLTLDLPVLLVRYSSHYDKLYYRWCHEIDLFYAKENSKTFRVSFPPNNFVSSNEFDSNLNLLKSIKRIKSGKISLPINSSLKISAKKIKDIPHILIEQKLKKELNEFKSVLSINEEERLLNITLSEEELTVNLVGFVGCTFHNIAKRDEKSFISDLAKDIILGFAVSLIQVGLLDLGVRVIFESKLETRLAQKRELFLKILPVLLDTTFFKKTFELIDQLLEEDNTSIIGPLAQAVTLFRKKSLTDEKIKALENFFEKRIKSALNSEDYLSAGMYSYNLGNHYRSQNQLFLAFKYYLQAKKYAPIYLKQSYFYSELAGVLFLLQKFRFSSHLYKIAIECGGPDEIKPRYADALMFAGFYKEAYDLFDSYLASSKDDTDEWILKRIMLYQLLEEYDLPRQLRKIEAAGKLSDVTEVETKEEKLDKLNKALELDLLCGLAWFNLGVLQAEEKNMEEATLSFTMCGLIQDGDIESWVNATLCSFNVESLAVITILIIRTAYSKFHDDYLNILYKNIASQQKPEVLEAVSLLVNEALPKISDRELPELRILHEDGKFRNILDTSLDR